MEVLQQQRRTVTMAKENKPILRHHKGWKGYVNSYHEYIDKHDDVDWNGIGTKDKKEEIVQQGAVTKIIIKF
jgi:hypothetical protein